MKRIFAVLMATMVVISCALSVGASFFTPSVTAKNAPELVPDANGKVAVVKDSNGNVVDSADATVCKLIPYADRNSDAEAKPKLETAYADLSEGKPQTQQKDKLKAYAAAANANYDERNMVVSDLFYLKVSDNIRNAIGNGKYLEITFKTGLAAADKAPAVIYACDGTTWAMIDTAKVTNNGNGTFTAKFDTLCPIALMSATSDYAPSPATSSNAILFGGIAVLSAAAVGVVVVMVKKSKEN